MKKGFTLIELMVAVAIIGIFASVVFVSLDSSRAKSRDALRVADLKNISLAAQSYFTEHGTFPVDIDSMGQYFAEGTTHSAPKDPKTGLQYWYVFVQSEHRYCVGAMMETNLESPTQPDAGCPVELGNYIIKGP